MTTEEQALRSALTDVVAGQPAAPHDRIDAVRRRHAHRRQRQLAALGTAVIVAITGAVFSVFGLRSGHGDEGQFAKRDLPAWAVQWADHRDPTIPDGYLGAAYASWQIDNPDVEVGPGAQVVWYVAERIPGDRLALAFEVGGADTVPMFVFGTTSATSLSTYLSIHFDKNTSLWLQSNNCYGANVTAASVLGLYSTATNDDTGRNTVVLLTDPHARSAQLSYIDPSGHVSRTVPMTAGFGAVEVGPLRSRVHVGEVRTANGKKLNGDLDVGVPGTGDDQSADPSLTPRLMPIPSFTDAPVNGSVSGEMSGQGSFFDASPEPGSRYRSTQIYARCFGRAASIEIHIDGDNPAQTVTVPCDDREHVIDGPGFLSTGTTVEEDPMWVGGQRPAILHTLDILTDDETAWRAVVVAR